MSTHRLLGLVLAATVGAFVTSVAFTYLVGELWWERNDLNPANS